MYNVRIFKFPLGWHIRVYSVPVGYCDNSAEHDCPIAYGSVMDEDSGEWVDVRYNPLKQAVEPFSFQLATRMPEERVKNPERSAASSLNRTRSRVNYLARSNVWDWFFTLTFNPDLVDSLDYEDCVKKLKSWLDSVRRKSPDMKYLIVPEKHPTSGRFHFHGLFAACDGLDFTDSGLVTSGKQTVYNIGRYRLGWSTATRVVDSQKATQYICKYITKELCMVSAGKKRYWASRNLDEAETEEYFLDGAGKAEYVESLRKVCAWSRHLDGSEVSVDYFEVATPLKEVS